MNLEEIYKRFPTQDDCLVYLEQIIWNAKPQCPYCGSFRFSPLKMKRRYHCNSCNLSFRVTVRTIFHKTKLDLQKWFLAISLILNTKEKISSRKLAENLGINRNTAWHIDSRIIRAMCEKQSRDTLNKIIEMEFN